MADDMILSNTIVSLSRETSLLSEAVRGLTTTASKLAERITTAENQIEYAVREIGRALKIIEGNNGQRSLWTEIELLKNRVENLEDEQEKQSTRRWQMIMWAAGGGGFGGGLIVLLSKVL